MNEEISEGEFTEIPSPEPAPVDPNATTGPDINLPDAQTTTLTTTGSKDLAQVAPNDQEKGLAIPQQKDSVPIDDLIASGAFTEEQIATIKKTAEMNQAEQKEIAAVQAKYDEYWGQDGKISAVVRAKIHPEMMRQVTEKYQKDALAAAEAALLNEPPETNREEFIAEFIEDYMARNDEQIKADIEKLAEEKVAEETESLKTTNLDDAFAVISGEEKGSPRFEEKKKTWLDSFKKAGMQWAVGYLETFKDVDLGTVLDFLMNPTSYGRSSGGKFESSKEQGEKVIDLSDFQGMLKRPDGQKDFIKALYKVYDASDGALKSLMRSPDMEAQFAKAKEGDPESMRKFMELFLHELFNGEDKVNARWHIIRTKVSEEFTGQYGKMFSQEIGNFFEDLKNDEDVFDQYFTEPAASVPTPSESKPQPEAQRPSQPPSQTENDQELPNAA